MCVSETGGVKGKAHFEMRHNLPQERESELMRTWKVEQEWARIAQRGWALLVCSQFCSICTDFTRLPPQWQLPRQYAHIKAPHNVLAHICPSDQCAVLQWQSVRILTGNTFPIIICDLHQSSNFFAVGSFLQQECLCEWLGSAWLVHHVGVW